MRALADLAERYGHGELRISHEQNVILPHVAKADLPAIHAALQAGVGHGQCGACLRHHRLPRHGLLFAGHRAVDPHRAADRHALRGTKRRARRRPAQDQDLGLHQCLRPSPRGPYRYPGLDRAGVENYQITLGGDHTETAAIGERAGPGFSADEIIPAIERLVLGYLDLREGRDETFLQAYRRLGPAPFKALLYPEARSDAA